MERVDALCREIFHTPPGSERRQALLGELTVMTDLTAEEAYRAAATLGSEAEEAWVERGADLSLKAWHEGYPNAGALHAACVDRLCLLRRALPKFGVNHWEHDGELMMPVIDGSVTDAERRALGLPSLAEVKVELELENRTRAEAVFRTGLPDDAQVRRVWRKWATAELLRHQPVWRDGDDLTLIYEGEAEEVRLIGGLQMPMWRIAESDLWVASLRIRNLDQAVIQFGFQAGGQSVEEGPGLHQWRGPEAPPQPERSSFLAGQVLQDEVQSPSLGTARGLTVYLPPDHDPDRPTPVVYAVDGQTLQGIIPALDHMIQTGEVPPVILIGTDHAGFTQGDGRSREYLPNLAPSRFEAHRRFFQEEVPLWAENAVGASRERSMRAVCGYSSGGVFAVVMGARHHDFYGHVMAFSLAGGPEFTPTWPSGEAPRFFLAAGTLETGFFRRTARLAENLATQGVEYRQVTRVCGHDLTLWHEELPRAIAWAFRDNKRPPSLDD